jgi:hypothetical protein
MAQKSIAQQIHELSQDGGLHDHSTGEQIVCPDNSRLREVKQWRVKAQDRDDSLTSMEAELKKYGFQVPVLVVSAEPTKQEAVVTLPNGEQKKGWV